MGRTKKALLLQMYRINEKTNRVIIDIALDRYLDYFHEWDNASFRKRDLHPELADFLDLCSEEIPLRRKLELNFCIKDLPEDELKEQMVIASYRNYYQSQLQMMKRSQNRLYRSALILFLAAISLIILYTLLKEGKGPDLLSKVTIEGVLIGAWVFMWETFHMVFFKSLEPMRRLHELKRFIDADLVFHSESVNSGS